MFRELRQPRGDPAVLASQSREQYFKVLIAVFGSISSIFFYLRYLRVSVTREIYAFHFSVFVILVSS